MKSRQTAIPQSSVLKKRASVGGFFALLEKVVAIILRGLAISDKAHSTTFFEEK